MKCILPKILSLCFSLLLTLSSFAQCWPTITVNTSSCDVSNDLYSANINVEISDPPSSGLVIIYHEGYTHVEDLSSYNVDPIVIAISVPYLTASGQDKTVNVTFPDYTSCNNSFTYQAVAPCGNNVISTVECACAHVEPADYAYVCNDGIDQIVLSGSNGFQGFAWYNDDGDFVTTDQILTVTSDTPGMEDGSAIFYMDGLDSEGMRPLNCCLTPILVKQCPVCDTDEKLHIEDGDIYLDNACHGVIMTSPNGTCYRMKVSNNGEFISELVHCPN